MGRARGCYLHLSVFPATSNLLMIIKEQRVGAPAARTPPHHPIHAGTAPHPTIILKLKSLLDKKHNQKKKIKINLEKPGRGGSPRTTCKLPATQPGPGGGCMQQISGFKTLFCA